MAEMKLGDLESSEQLIRDLYIYLRKKISFWADITKQTAQARMGYVGQHLASVVSGHPGGKSGARGRDLILPDDKYGEIKTCYRVDQLGWCESCGARIASIEEKCPVCDSEDIHRNDDSKWLIGIRNETELANIVEPTLYYLVLFDFISLDEPKTIRASIWEVDPKCPGFAYCVVDYNFNIRAQSRSKAPFNLWPYELKFALMKPEMIYQSFIDSKEDTIRTAIFPGRDEAVLYPLRSLEEYARSRNLTVEKATRLAESLGMETQVLPEKKRDLLEKIQAHINRKKIHQREVCDKLASCLYMEDIKEYFEGLPSPLKERIVAIRETVDF